MGGMVGGLVSMEVELETCGCVVVGRANMDIRLGAGATELYVLTDFIVKPSLVLGCRRRDISGSTAS